MVVRLLFPALQARTLAAFQSQPAPLQMLNKLLILLGITCSCWGCSADLGSRRATRIQELERYTSELEAKLTALEEQSLRRSHAACPASAVRRGDVEAASQALQPSRKGKSEVTQRGTAPDTLPVVRLSPTQPQGAVPVDEADPEAPATSGANGDQTNTELLVEASHVGTQERTRPVLKVHGAQEGHVYHRTLTAADKEPGASL